MGQPEWEVERLVRENQRLVHLVVNRHLARYPLNGMEWEDLISWGMIGLVQAARAWDPERTRSFSTLACKAIERMIFRGVMREGKPEQAAVTVSLDALVSGEETGGREDSFLERLASDQDIESDMLDRETHQAVRAAVAALPTGQRRLIELHFYEEIPVTHAAAALGVSRQSASMWQRTALRTLRVVLSATPPVVPHSTVQRRSPSGQWLSACVPDWPGADADPAGGHHDVEYDRYDGDDEAHRRPGVARGSGRPRPAGDPDGG
jgi:RNA polymerase sigma factor FliA